MTKPVLVQGNVFRIDPSRVSLFLDRDGKRARVGEGMVDASGCMTATVDDPELVESLRGRPSCSISLEAGTLTRVDAEELFEPRMQDLLSFRQDGLVDALRDLDRAGRVELIRSTLRTPPEDPNWSAVAAVLRDLLDDMGVSDVG